MFVGLYREYLNKQTGWPMRNKIAPVYIRAMLDYYATPGDADQTMIDALLNKGLIVETMHTTGQRYMLSIKGERYVDALCDVQLPEGVGVV